MLSCLNSFQIGEYSDVDPFLAKNLNIDHSSEYGRRSHQALQSMTRSNFEELACRLAGETIFRFGGIRCMVGTFYCFQFLLHSHIKNERDMGKISTRDAEDVFAAVMQRVSRSWEGVGEWKT